MPQLVAWRCSCEHTERGRQSHSLVCSRTTGMDRRKQFCRIGILNTREWGCASVPQLLLRPARLLSVRLDRDICAEARSFRSCITPLTVY